PPGAARSSRPAPPPAPRTGGERIGRRRGANRRASGLSVPSSARFLVSGPPPQGAALPGSQTLAPTDGWVKAAEPARRVDGRRARPPSLSRRRREGAAETERREPVGRAHARPA